MMRSFFTLLYILIGFSVAAQSHPGFDFKVDLVKREISIRPKNVANFQDFSLERLIFLQTDDSKVLRINSVDYNYIISSKNCSSSFSSYTTPDARPEFIPNSICEYTFTITSSGATSNTSTNIGKIAAYPSVDKITINSDGHFEQKLSSGGTNTASTLNTQGYRFQLGKYITSSATGAIQNLVFEKDVKQMTDLQAILGIKALKANSGLANNETRVIRIWRNPNGSNPLPSDYFYIHLSYPTTPTYSLPIVGNRILFTHSSAPTGQKYSLQYYANKRKLTNSSGTNLDKTDSDLSTINSHLFDTWNIAHKNVLTNTSLPDKKIIVLLKIHSTQTSYNAGNLIAKMTVPSYIPLEFDLDAHKGTYDSRTRKTYYLDTSGSEDKAKYEVRYLPLASDTTYEYIEFMAPRKNTNERYGAFFHEGNFPNQVRKSDIISFDDILYKKLLTSGKYAYSEFYTYPTDSNRLYFKLGRNENVNVTVFQAPLHDNSTLEHIPLNSKDIFTYSTTSSDAFTRAFATNKRPRGEVYVTHFVRRAGTKLNQITTDYDNGTISSHRPFIYWYPKFVDKKLEDFRVPYKNPEHLTKDKSLFYEGIKNASSRYSSELSLKPEQAIDKSLLDHNLFNTLKRYIEPTTTGSSYRFLTSSASSIVDNVRGIHSMVDVFFVAHYQDYLKSDLFSDLGRLNNTAYLSAAFDSIPGEIFYGFYYKLKTFLNIDFEQELLYVKKSDFDQINKSETIDQLYSLAQCGTTVAENLCFTPSNKLTLLPATNKSIGSISGLIHTTAENAVKTNTKILFRVKGNKAKGRLRGDLDTLALDIKRQPRPLEDGLFKIDYFNIEIDTTTKFDRRKHILQSASFTPEGTCPKAVKGVWSDVSISTGKNNSLAIQNTKCYRIKFSEKNNVFSSVADSVIFNGRWNDLFFAYDLTGKIGPNNPNQYYFNLKEFPNLKKFDYEYKLQSSPPPPNADSLDINPDGTHVRKIIEPHVYRLSQTFDPINKELILYYPYSDKHHIFRSRVANIKLDTVKLTSDMIVFDRRRRVADTPAVTAFNKDYVIDHLKPNPSTGLTEWIEDSVNIKPKNKHNYRIRFRKELKNNPRFNRPVPISRISTDTTYYSLLAPGVSSFEFDTVHRPHFETYPETEKFTLFNKDYATTSYKYYRLLNYGLLPTNYSTSTLASVPIGSTGLSAEFDIEGKFNKEFIIDSITVGGKALMSSLVSTYIAPPRFDLIHFDIGLDALGNNIMIQFDSRVKGDSTVYVRVGTKDSYSTYEQFLKETRVLMTLPSGTNEKAINGNSNDKYTVITNPSTGATSDKDLGDVRFYIGYDFYDKSGVQKLRTNHSKAITLQIADVQKPSLNINYATEKATNVISSSGINRQNYTMYILEGTKTTFATNAEVAIVAGKDMTFKVSDNKSDLTVIKPSLSAVPPLKYLVKAPNFKNLTINIPRYDPKNAEFDISTLESRVKIPKGTRYIRLNPSQNAAMDAITTTQALYTECKSRINAASSSSITTLTQDEKIRYLYNKNSNYYCLHVPHKDHRYFHNYFLVKVPERGAPPEIKINYYSETLALESSVDLSKYQYKKESGGWLPLTNRLMSIDASTEYQFRTIGNFGRGEEFSTPTIIKILRNSPPSAGEVAIDYEREKLIKTGSLPLTKYSIHRDPRSISGIYNDIPTADNSIAPGRIYITRRHSNPDGSSTNLGVVYDTKGKYRSPFWSIGISRVPLVKIPFNYSLAETVSPVSRDTYLFSCNTAANLNTFTTKALTSDIKIKLNHYQMCVYYAKHTVDKYRSISDTLVNVKVPAPTRLAIDHIKEELDYRQTSLDSLNVQIATEGKSSKKTVTTTSEKLTAKDTVYVAYKNTINRDLLLKYYRSTGQESLISNFLVEAVKHPSFEHKLPVLKQVNLISNDLNINYNTEVLSTTVDSVHFITTYTPLANDAAVLKAVNDSIAINKYSSLKKSVLHNLSVHTKPYLYIWRPAFKNTSGQLYLKSDIIPILISRPTITPLNTAFTVDWKENTISTNRGNDMYLKKITASPVPTVRHILSDYTGFISPVINYNLTPGTFWFYANYLSTPSHSKFRSDMDKLEVKRYTTTDIQMDTIKNKYIHFQAYLGSSIPTSTSDQIDSIYRLKDGVNSEITSAISTSGAKPQYTSSTELLNNAGKIITYTLFKHGEILSKKMNVEYMAQPAKPNIRFRANPTTGGNRQFGPLAPNLMYSTDGGTTYSNAPQYITPTGTSTYHFISKGNLEHTSGDNYRYFPASEDSIVTVKRLEAPKMYTHFTVDSLAPKFSIVDDPTSTIEYKKSDGTWAALPNNFDIVIDQSKLNQTTSISLRRVSKTIHLTSNEIVYTFKTPTVYNEPVIDYDTDLIQAKSGFRHYILGGATPQILLSRYIRPSGSVYTSDITLMVIPTTALLSSTDYTVGVYQKFTFTKPKPFTKLNVKTLYKEETLDFAIDNPSISTGGSSKVRYRLNGTSTPYAQVSSSNYKLDLKAAPLSFETKTDVSVQLFHPSDPLTRTLNSDTVVLSYTRPSIASSLTTLINTENNKRQLSFNNPSQAVLRNKAYTATPLYSDVNVSYDNPRTLLSFSETSTLLVYKKATATNFKSSIARQLLTVLPSPDLEVDFDTERLTPATATKANNLNDLTAYTEEDVIRVGYSEFGANINQSFSDFFTAGAKIKPELVYTFTRNRTSASTQHFLFDAKPVDINIYRKPLPSNPQHYLLSDDIFTVKSAFSDQIQIYDNSNPSSGYQLVSVFSPGGITNLNLKTVVGFTGYRLRFPSQRNSNITGLYKSLERPIFLNRRLVPSFEFKKDTLIYKGRNEILASDELAIFGFTEVKGSGALPHRNTVCPRELSDMRSTRYNELKALANISVDSMNTASTGYTKRHMKLKPSSIYCAYKLEIAKNKIKPSTPQVIEIHKPSVGLTLDYNAETLFQSISIGRAYQKFTHARTKVKPVTFKDLEPSDVNVVYTDNIRIDSTYFFRKPQTIRPLGHDTTLVYFDSDTATFAPVRQLVKYLVVDYDKEKIDMKDVSNPAVDLSGKIFFYQGYVGTPSLSLNLAPSVDYRYYFYDSSENKYKSEAILFNIPRATVGILDRDKTLELDFAARQLIVKSAYGDRGFYLAKNRALDSDFTKQTSSSSTDTKINIAPSIRYFLKVAELPKPQYKGEFKSAVFSKGPYSKGIVPPIKIDFSSEKFINTDGSEVDLTSDVVLERRNNTSSAYGVMTTTTTKESPAQYRFFRRASSSSRTFSSDTITVAPVLRHEFDYTIDYDKEYVNVTYAVQSRSATATIRRGAVAENISANYVILPDLDYVIFIAPTTTTDLSGIFASRESKFRVTRNPQPTSLNINYQRESLNRALTSTEMYIKDSNAPVTGSGSSPIAIDLGSTYRVYTNYDRTNFKSLPLSFSVTQRYPQPTVNMDIAKEELIRNLTYDYFTVVDPVGAIDGPRPVNTNISVYNGNRYTLYKNANAATKKYRSPNLELGPFTRAKKPKSVLDLSGKTMKYTAATGSPDLTTCSELKVTRATSRDLFATPEAVIPRWNPSEKSCEINLNNQFRYQVVRIGRFNHTGPTKEFVLNSTPNLIGPLKQHPTPTLTVNTATEQTNELADGLLVCTSSCSNAANWNVATAASPVSITEGITYQFKKAGTPPITLESDVFTVNPVVRLAQPKHNIDYYHRILFFEEDNVQIKNASGAWIDINPSSRVGYKSSMPITVLDPVTFSKKYSATEFRSVEKTITLNQQFNVPRVTPNYGYLNNEKIIIDFLTSANVPDSIAIQVNSQPWKHIKVPGTTSYSYDIRAILNSMPVNSFFQFSVRSIGSNLKSKFASIITRTRVNTRQSIPQEDVDYKISYQYEDITPLNDSLYIDGLLSNIENGTYTNLKFGKYNADLVEPSATLYLVKPNTTNSYASLPTKATFADRTSAPTYSINFPRELLVFNTRGILFSKKIVHATLLDRTHDLYEDIDFYYTLLKDRKYPTDTIYLQHPSYGGRMNPTDKATTLYYSSIASEKDKQFRSNVATITLQRPSPKEFYLNFDTEKIHPREAISDIEYTFDVAFSEPKVKIHRTNQAFNITDTIDWFNEKSNYAHRAFEVHLRVPATTTHFASQPFQVVVPQRQSAPGLLINYDLENIYTSNAGEIIQISNDKNFRKAPSSYKVDNGSTINLSKGNVFEVPTCGAAPMVLHGILKPNHGFLGSKMASITIPPRARPSYFEPDYVHEQSVKDIPADLKYSVNNKDFNLTGTNTKVAITPGTNINYYQTSGSTRFKSCEMVANIKPRRKPKYAVNYIAERMINLDNQNSALRYNYTGRTWHAATTNDLLRLKPAELFSVVYLPIPYQEFKSDTTKIMIDPRPDLSYIKPDFPNLSTSHELSSLIQISYDAAFSDPFNFSQPQKLTLQSLRHFWIYQSPTAKSFRSAIYYYEMPKREYRNISIYHIYDYANEMVTYEPQPRGRYEYSYNPEFTNRKDVNGPIKITPGGELYYRVKGSNIHFPTYPILFEVKERPSSSDIEIDFNYRTGTIGTALGNNMEYAFTEKCNTSPDKFIVGNSQSFTKLNSGQCIHIRKNYTDRDFRSKSRAFEIPRRVEEDLNISINFLYERTNEIIPPTMEYSTTDEFLVYDQGGNGLLPLYPNDTIYFRHKRRGDNMPSVPYKLAVPARPTSPRIDIDYVKEETKTKLATNMSYSYQLNNNFSSFDGNGKVLKLTAGRTYHVWYRATNKWFKSQIDTLVIHKRPTIELQQSTSGVFAETTLLLNLYDNDTKTEITTKDFEYKNIKITELKKITDSTYQIVTVAQSGFNLSSIHLKADQAKRRFKSSKLTVPSAAKPLILWPNPSNGIVNIQSQVLLQSVLVYSLQGEIVKRFRNNSTLIDITELPKGQYILVGFDKNGNRYSQIVTKID